MNYNNAKFLKSYGTFSQLPPCDKREIAFSGRSNVGKSTLINKLIRNYATVAQNELTMSPLPSTTLTTITSSKFCFSFSKSAFLAANSAESSSNIFRLSDPCAA